MLLWHGCLATTGSVAMAQVSSDYYRKCCYSKGVQLLEEVLLQQECLMTTGSAAVARVSNIYHRKYCYDK